MKFKKQTMQEIVDIAVDKTFDFADGLTVKKISDEMVDTSRWSIIHEMIFKIGDQFFSSTYRVGATECQDEGPYEYDEDEIECEEVFPVEVTVVKYLPKKDLPKKV